MGCTVEKRERGAPPPAHAVHRDTQPMQNLSVLTRGSAHVYKAVDADSDLERYFGTKAGQECTGGME